MANSSPIRVPARAKVNLFLHVTGKRDDGYHLLDSMVVFPEGVEDFINIEPSSEDLSFTITGEFSGALQGNDLSTSETSGNLVVRAARAFCVETSRDCHLTLHLEKNIPPGAGLGGGSSDAAATLRGLQTLHEPSLSEERLAPMLLSLGADVPVCYRGTPCRFQGIGELTSPVSHPPALYMVLVWPAQASATKDVFKNFKGPFSAPASIPPRFTDAKDFIGFLQTTRNDLTDAAERACPAIGIARESMNHQEGCALARMSGSGSSVFGLFSTEKDCRKAAESLKKNHPDWWVKPSRI